MSTVHVNGIDMYYEIHGKGKPLLLIAGLSCDCLLWTPILDELAKNYQVTIFDNRGVGRSSAPASKYTAEQMAEDAFALLMTLKIPKAHVLGHSMGGAIAQCLAYKHPQAIDKLILCCTAQKFPLLCDIVQKGILQLRETNTPVPIIVDVILPWLYSNHFFLQQDKINAVREIMINQTYPQLNQGFAGQLNAIQTFDSTPWINKLLHPTLVLSGGEDLLCPSEGPALAKAIQQSLMIEFPHTGHLPFIEEPADFLRHLKIFLEFSK